MKRLFEGFRGFRWFREFRTAPAKPSKLSKPSKPLFFIGFALFLCTSCKSLQPYERIYVNDREMQMGLSGGQAFENYVESIREAALPAGGQKASGGCGCN